MFTRFSKCFGFSVVVGLMTVNNGFADDFSLALDVLQKEAHSQYSYFKGRIEECQVILDESTKDCKGNIFPVKSSSEPGQMPLVANYAQQSALFWRAIESSIELISDEYSKLPDIEGNKYEIGSIQAIIDSMLIEVNRAAFVAFSDTLIQIKNLFLELDDDKSFHEFADSLAGKAIKNASEDLKRSPEKHPHLNFDLEKVTPFIKNNYGKLPVYSSYFMDYKALYAFYHYLNKFRVNRKPIPQQSEPQFPNNSLRWVDSLYNKIFSLVQPYCRQGFFFFPKTLKNSSNERAHPLEGNFVFVSSVEEWIVKSLIEPRGKKFKEAIQSDILALEQKKKTNVVEVEAVSVKSTSKKNRKERRADFQKKPNGKGADLSPILISSKISPSREEKIILESSPSIEENLEEDESWAEDYAIWVELQKSLSSEKETNSNTITNTNDQPEPVGDLNADLHPIVLTKGAAKIYSTAMGYGDYATTNSDLKEFLKQVGGRLVKLSGVHSDPKILLPNFSPNATERHLVDKMHLMHNGTDTFPVSRLKIHLRRMIIRARLDQRVELSI